MKKVDSFAFDADKWTGFISVKYDKLVALLGDPETSEKKFRFGSHTYFTWYGEFSDGSKFAIQVSESGMVRRRGGVVAEGHIIADPTPAHYEEFNKVFPKGLMSRSREKYGKW